MCVCIFLTGMQSSVYSMIVIISWRRLCHRNDFQEIINTNSSKITIQFHSDTLVNGTGFIANITWRECKCIDIVELLH